MNGLKDSPLSVAAYPTAWRVEVVNDDPQHHGFEYVRWELEVTRCIGALCEHNMIAFTGESPGGLGLYERGAKITGRRSDVRGCRGAITERSVHTGDHLGR